MVKKWKKDITILQKSTQIDFDGIILDILSGNYEKYDCIKLSWSTNTFRVRVWKYRIVFTDTWWIIQIIWVDSRWDIYKKL